MLARALGNKVSVIKRRRRLNAHPTQALLDLFSMREVKPSVLGTKVANHWRYHAQRVARSIFGSCKSSAWTYTWPVRPPWYHATSIN